MVDRPEHEVRETKQSLNGSDHMARRPKALEKTDIQRSLSETSENLASACSAAFVLSGVLERLQHLDEKMKQVISNYFSFLLTTCINVRAVFSLDMLAFYLFSLGYIKRIKILSAYLLYSDDICVVN